MARKRICILYEELVDEILLRLSVKDLLVCKCVCKDWCALIKSPSFVNRHYSHQSNPECLVFAISSIEKGGGGKQTFAMYDNERPSLVDAPNHLRQMPSCNDFLGPEKGIFCVTNAFSTRICLLNLATREFKILPPHPLNDPGKDWPTVGFGLDPCTGDFKVVVFEKSAFVYSLSSDSWKRIGTNDLLDKIVSCKRMGIPLSRGVEHWLVLFDDRDVYSILSFDMRSDKFRVIAIPDALKKTGKRLRITAYCDSIALLSFERERGLDLWVMGRDGLWSKNFCVGPIEKYMQPLCVWEKNEVLLSTLSSPLMKCDISTQKVTAIIPRMSEKLLYPFLHSHFMYKESLVSIKGERANCILDYSD